MISGSKLLKLGRRGWTRTSDPQLRRLMLYPPELRAHVSTILPWRRANPKRPLLPHFPHGQPLRLREVRAGQAEAESRAAAGGRFHPHVATVIQDGLPRQRQAQAQPVALSRAHEGLEQLRANLLRDPGASVLDMD